MRVLTDERVVAVASPTPRTTGPEPPPRPVGAVASRRSTGQRDPHAVTALLAVLTVGLGSLLAIVALWATV